MASGAFCSCYRHPMDSARCIKLPTENKKAGKRLRADLAYYRKLSRKAVRMDHIAQYWGTCDTNLGRGYMYECVTDENQNISLTLEHYLKQGELKRKVIFDALESLKNALIDNRILISDLHARNILLKRNEVDACKAVLVDGIGDRVAIEILNLFPVLVEKKIRRRWDRFLTGLEA